MKKIIMVSVFALNLFSVNAEAKSNYTFEELEQMIHDGNKIPDSKAPILSKFYSFDSPFKECRKGADVVIENAKGMFPVVIDIDNEKEKHFKFRSAQLRDVFTLECVNDEQRVYNAEYK